MRQFKSFVLILFIVAPCTRSFCQDAQILDSIPTTKEGFVRSEPAVINSIDWLENHAPDQEVDKRKDIALRFTAWVTNSPTVTIELNEKICPFFKKNPDLLIIFMAGWTKYCLQNGYSKDQVKCNLAGVRDCIKFYQHGYGLKKDKEMEKIIQLEEKGELDASIAAKLGVQKG